jgi:hypothetical protein
VDNQGKGFEGTAYEAVQQAPRQAGREETVVETAGRPQLDQTHDVHTPRGLRCASRGER